LIEYTRSTVVIEQKKRHDRDEENFGRGRWIWMKTEKNKSNSRDNFSIALGWALAKRRLALSLSQKEVGQACGLDQSYVSSVERGYHRIGITNLRKLANALQLQPIQLMTKAKRNQRQLIRERQIQNADRERIREEIYRLWGS
jgi:transcriptional regulator with XRE-family HTH domain